MPHYKADRLTVEEWQSPSARRVGSQTEGEMLVSFFIVDAHRNEILLRYFGTPNDRSTQVNGQIVYARFFYDRTRARRLPFKELFIQVPFAFACKRLRFHNRSDL